MTKQTLRLLLEILGQVSLSAADPDLEAKVESVLNARRELTEALAAADEASA